MGSKTLWLEDDVYAKLRHPVERHRRSPKPRLVEPPREFGYPLPIDSLQRYVDVLGGAGPSGQDGDVPRDVLDTEVANVLED